MNVLRRMVVSLFAALLGAVLIGVAWTNIGAATIRNKQVVTGWLDKSNFYNNAADIIVENIAKSTQKSGDQGIPLSDPAVKEIITNALSSDFIRNSTKTVIDSAYQWFGSSEQDLAFKIDFTPVKTQIVDGLTAYAKTRAATLPKCGAVDGNSPIDPLVTTCLPRGTTPDQVATLARSFVMDQDFLKNPVLLGSDIEVSKDGQKIPLTSDSKLVATRKAYKLSSFAPLGLTVFALLLSVGIVFLSRSRIKGLARVGTIFLTTGFGLGIVYGGLRYFFGWGSKHLANMPGGLNSNQKLGIDLARVVLNDIERVLLIYTVAFLVIGIGSKVAAMIAKKRHAPAKPEVESEKSGPPAPEAIPRSMPSAPEGGRDLTPIEPRSPIQGAPTVPRRPRPPTKLQF